jgi:hypothetical protein
MVRKKRFCRSIPNGFSGNLVKYLTSMFLKNTKVKDMNLWGKAGAGTEGGKELQGEETSPLNDKSNVIRRVCGKDFEFVAEHGSGWRARHGKGTRREKGRWQRADTNATRLAEDALTVARCVKHPGRRNHELKRRARPPALTSPSAVSRGPNWADVTQTLQGSRVRRI